MSNKNQKTPERIDDNDLEKVSGGKMFQSDTNIPETPQSIHLHEFEPVGQKNGIVMYQCKYCDIKILR